MRGIRYAIASGAVALLILGGAAPAFADHNAGAGLTNATGGPRACYAGAMTPGTPPVDISTTKWTTVKRDGKLHLACYFTVPLFLPNTSIGVDKDDWVAPTRPTVTVSQLPICLPPGADAETQLWPDGTAAPLSKTTVVANKTSLVLYCAWPLSQLP